MVASAPWLNDYLEILGQPRREPSYDYLGDLAAAQLNRVPFENITKLERWPRREPIPSLEAWLRDVRERGHGGTCYVQNRGLCELANALGFEAHLSRLGNNHVGVLVKSPDLPDEHVYIDCGSVAPIFKPIRFEKDVSTTASFGNEVIVLKRSETDGPFRYLRTISKVVVQDEWPFDPARKLTPAEFEAMTYTPPGALFMTMLRCQIWDMENDRSKSLVNCVYRVRYADGRTTSQTLTTEKEIIDLVADEFGRPKLPTAAAIAVLRDLEVDALMPRDAPPPSRRGVAPTRT